MAEPEENWFPTRLPQRKEQFAHFVAAFVPPDIAYLRSGYRSRPEFARGNASKLLREPAVIARITELRAAFRETCAIDLERLQRLLMPLVEANFMDYVEAKGGASTKRRKRKDGKALVDAKTSLRFKSPDRLTYEQGAAIAGAKLENGEIVDIKLHSKTDAARVLLSTLGIGGGEGELAALDLGAKLGQALERAHGASGTVIDGEIIEEDRKPIAPAVAPQKFKW